MYFFAVVSAFLVRFINCTCFLIKFPGHSSAVLWLLTIAIAGVSVVLVMHTGLAEDCYQHKQIRHILSRP